MPCGYINQCKEISPYTGKPFPVLPNASSSGEDGAPSFIFGTQFSRSDDTATYFSQDLWKDGVVKTGDVITWKSHAKDILASDIQGVMFGAGVGASTSNLYMGQTEGKATDNCYCIAKFQQYYLSG